MEEFEGVSCGKSIGIVMEGKMKVTKIEEIGENGQRKRLNIIADVADVSILPKYIDRLKNEHNVEIYVTWTDDELEDNRIVDLKE